MKVLFTLIFLLCFIGDLGISATEAQTSNEKLTVEGVWSGTIGANKVQVCFNGSNESVYYYLRHKAGVRLEQPEEKSNGLLWLEKVHDAKSWDWKTTGTWKLNPPLGNSVSGEWVGLDKSLPIQLRLLSRNTTYSCADSFYAPIISAIHPKFGSAVINGRPIRTIETDSGNAFIVPDDAQNSKLINRFTQSWIESQAIESFNCRLNGGGGWHKELTIQSWTHSWLILQDLLPDTYCGGAHGGWSIGKVIIDVQTGKFTNSWLWFTSNTNGIDNDTNARSIRLRKLILKRNPRADCDDPMFLRHPFPTNAGMAFPTGYSHASRACEDEVVIAYKELTPFLTQLGRAAIQSLQLELETKN